MFMTFYATNWSYGCQLRQPSSLCPAAIQKQHCRFASSTRSSRGRAGDERRVIVYKRVPSWWYPVLPTCRQHAKARCREVVSAAWQRSSTGAPQHWSAAAPPQGLSSVPLRSALCWQQPPHTLSCGGGSGRRGKRGSAPLGGRASESIARQGPKVSPFHELDHARGARGRPEILARRAWGREYMNMTVTQLLTLGCARVGAREELVTVCACAMFERLSALDVERHSMFTCLPGDRLARTSPWGSWTSFATAATAAATPPLPSLVHFDYLSGGTCCAGETRCLLGAVIGRVGVRNWRVGWGKLQRQRLWLQAGSLRCCGQTAVRQGFTCTESVRVGARDKPKCACVFASWKCVSLCYIIS